MLHSIVAGCDGLARGREAVAFAASLADATGARLLLVSAYQTPPLPFPTSFREHARETDEAIRRLRDELAPNARTTVVEALSAPHALRHVAAHEDADLIVVGSSGHRARHRILDGDHSLQVLHAASRAVAVVPDGTAVAARPARIAVGYDGSPESRAALALAADLARSTDARLVLETVVDSHRPPWASEAAGFDWPGWQDRRLDDAHRLGDEAIAALPGVNAGAEVTLGDPARRLADVAASADLLVIGSRKWGPLARLALGSTSEAVVRHATGPVLVLPRGAENAPEVLPAVDAAAAAR